jgi:hypothetical protein
MVGQQQLKKSGFSLLELSLIMFIMMILLGFSLPRFSHLFENELQLETQKLARLIDELRLEAILNGENHKLIFDTQKSEYTVLSSKADHPHQYSPHSRFKKPILIQPPVQLLAVSTLENPEENHQFAGRKITFDKIFGQEFHILIDSSGFIDLFTLRLKDSQNQLSLSVVNIMGKMVIGKETPL